MLNFVRFVRNAWASDSGRKETTESDLSHTSAFLVVIGLFGIIMLFLWAFYRTGPWQSTFAFGMLIMGGASLVGGVLGLLFGIPKSVSEPASVAPPPANNSGNQRTDTASNSVQRTGYSVNTNLEQISDWLTKIIVGVSLTEIPAIRGEFHEMATYFGNGFIAGVPPTASPAEPVVAAGIIIYGLTAGFLAGYLFTRIFLPGAFERVDSALRTRNKELVSQIAEVRETTETAGRMQGEIYSGLYRYSEQGFREVISKIKDLFASPANKRNAAFGYIWQRHMVRPIAGNKKIGWIPILRSRNCSASIETKRISL